MEDARAARFDGDAAVPGDLILSYDTARFDFRAWMLDELARFGFAVRSLEVMHETVPASRVSELMEHVARASRRGPIRALVEEFAREYLVPLLEVPLAVQPALDIRALYPERAEMALPLHTDAMFGHDAAETIIWIPLTDANASASLWIVDEAIARPVLSEDLGIEVLEQTLRPHARALRARFGEAVLFASTDVHGSVANRTSFTRVSVDLRVVPLAIARTSAGVARHYLPL